MTSMHSGALPLRNPNHRVGSLEGDRPRSTVDKLAKVKRTWQSTASGHAVRTRSAEQTTADGNESALFVHRKRRDIKVRIIDSLSGYA